MWVARGNRAAFGKPGLEPKWTHGNKDGVGTAYSGSSRLWFTIFRGVAAQNVKHRVCFGANAQVFRFFNGAPSVPPIRRIKQKGASLLRMPLDPAVWECCYCLDCTFTLLKLMVTTCVADTPLLSVTVRFSR